MTDEQKYTGNNHILGSRIHIAACNAPVLLRDGDQEWLIEWHYYFGPCRLNKRTGDPLAKQPAEKSRFWLVAQWWKDQGAKVVDGVGVWQEPMIIEERCCRVDGKLIPDPTGDVVFRYYEGYEQWGSIR